MYFINNIMDLFITSWVYILVIEIFLISSIIFIIINKGKNQVIKEVLDKENLNITGFSYDERQDIFYGTLNNLQRKFGYFELYDELATPFNIVVDREIVNFEYDNKKWLIEFWKGQYGITTGAEIGIYNKNIDTTSDIEYKNINDEELLTMTFLLFKNNKFFFSRSDRHWWLSGFKLGEFSYPKELKMHILITLKDKEMKKAFVNGLLQTGYKEESLIISDTSVEFLYTKPYTTQALTRIPFLDEITQERNKFLCDEYNHLTKKLLGSINKLEYLRKKKPNSYNKIKVNSIVLSGVNNEN